MTQWLNAINLACGTASTVTGCYELYYARSTLAKSLAVYKIAVGYFSIIIGVTVYLYDQDEQPLTTKKIVKVVEPELPVAPMDALTLLQKCFKEGGLSCEPFRKKQL